MHLDEYLVADNRRRMGFSATSEQIAEHLLRQWPRRDLWEATYLTGIPLSAANRYIGLRGAHGIVLRVFIARQQLLLAMRRVLVEAEPSAPGRTMDLDTTAIMLSHALASGSDPERAPRSIELATNAANEASPAAVATFRPWWPAFTTSTCCRLPTDGRPHVADEEERQQW